MKKRLLVAGCLLLVIFVSGQAWGAGRAADRENINLKAGPTEAGESLSLAWLEAFVSPKAIKEKGTLFLGVRATSKVKAVRAAFDFNPEGISLSSRDGLSWSGEFKIADTVTEGVHAVRYQISGNRGAIQRTVEFFVEKTTQFASIAPAASLQKSGWPLTVTASCAALAGNSSRLLHAGQKLTGLSKAPWYKVLFEDGQQGWVSSAAIKEPTGDYQRLGYEAYRLKNYALAVKNFRSATAIDPAFAKGYRWLAKSYLAQENLDAAAEAIKGAVRLDDRDIDSRAVAGALAQKYFSMAHRKFKSGTYHEAVAGFRKALDLNPDSMASWFEMGESFKRLGLEDEAREAWRKAARLDVVAAPVKSSVSPMVVGDSLQIIKDGKTDKGTRIEAALKSVIGLTKSLGTPIVEKGWQIRKQGEKCMVSYLCEQSGGAPESFDWLVDVDTRRVVPNNENARLLVSRW